MQAQETFPLWISIIWHQMQNIEVEALLVATHQVWGYGYITNSKLGKSNLWD
jgi:hypothetical protein